MSETKLFRADDFEQIVSEMHGTLWSIETFSRAIAKQANARTAPLVEALERLEAAPGDSRAQDACGAAYRALKGEG
jgi:hypothetical protein